MNESESLVLSWMNRALNAEAENKWFREAINVRDAEDQRTIDTLKEERDRYKEVLFYLRDSLLHSRKDSYAGALWRAIDKALFPPEGGEASTNSV